MLAMHYSTTPHSSSPLNPHRSSSPPPMSSPSPSTCPLPLSLVSGPSRPRVSPNTTPRPPRQTQTTSPNPLSARYRNRPTAPPTSIQSDLFSEGTTPTQGAMWRDRLQRRIKDRERRKKDRESDLARRRGTDTAEEVLEAQAQADDEEIFRRLMVLQRRREEHAALAALDGEGGSDPHLPEFWEEELEQELVNSLDDPDWEMEAAMAEEEERRAQDDEADEFSQDDWAIIAALTEPGPPDPNAMDTSE